MRDFTLASQLYQGELEHVRCTPKVHRFVYPYFCCGFDLDELETLAKRYWFFSINAFNILSISPNDYLFHRQGSLRERVCQTLHDAGCDENPARIELVTHPRIFSYIFNPVSFFRCYRSDQTLFAVVAQVNNTFGESHLYVLTEPSQTNSFVTFRVSKEFHVSPFNDLRGMYRFYFREDSQQRLDIRINIEKDSEIVFTSRMAGAGIPFAPGNIFSTLCRYPGSLLLTSYRITAQAARLYFEKGLRVYTKPIAAHKMSIRKAAAGPVQRLCMNIGFRFLSRIRQGYIRVECDDGAEFEFGTISSYPHATIYVRNYDFFVRSVLSGDIGFGESYVDGQWDCSDLPALLRIFLLNESELDDRSIAMTYLGRAYNRVAHLLRPNSVGGSKKNISAHYDLSNDLFQSFLDPTMTYSSAMFLSPEDSLETAQLQKIRALISKAQLNKNDHVLEIGCGWGSFAITAAKEIGCRVTGITLSKEQLQFAQQRVEAEGLTHLVELKLCDYRELTGTYDKIVSIEMLEAVGHSFLGSFFETCDRLLAPNGLIALQVITFPDYRYASYRYGCDWVQKYIFPGGLCPSLTAICGSAAKTSRLVLEETDNIGVHYAETLARWRETFLQNFESIRPLGFDDRFKRMWTYYLCYCEAGFSSRTLGTHQLVFSRPHNRSLGSFRAPEMHS
jgi:cyclopropane-fatty-acyl-phospholipid synthase